MQFPSWLRELTARSALARAGCPRRRARSRRSTASSLHLERLEDRLCLSSYSITDLGTLGGTTSFAEAINNHGQVAGGARTGVADVGHAFLWTPGAKNGVPANPQMQDLGSLPNLPYSEAFALNDAGQVVGRALTTVVGPGSDGFFWNGTAMIDLGALGGLPGNGTVSVATTTPGAFPGTAAVQTITFGGTITGGTFTLSFNGTSTTAIAWSPNATTLAANIQAALSPVVPATVSTTSATTDTVTFPYPGPEPTMTACSLATTIAYAVNDATANHPVQVVGQSRLVDGADHAFLWENGVLTDLNALIPANSGWVLSTATGINDNQQIVGAGYHNGLYRPFLWQVGGGVITDLGALAAARAVNQAGRVAGGTRLAPYLWAGETTTILPTWPGTPSGNTQAVALNGASQVQVVGYCQDFTDVVPGFGGALLWQDGQAINLTSQIPKSAKWSLWYAYGINDAGRIVGSGSNGSGLQHAFLLTPPRRKLRPREFPPRSRQALLVQPWAFPRESILPRWRSPSLRVPCPRCRLTNRRRLWLRGPIPPGRSHRPGAPRSPPRCAAVLVTMI